LKPFCITNTWRFYSHIDSFEFISKTKLFNSKTKLFNSKIPLFNSPPSNSTGKLKNSTVNGHEFNGKIGKFYSISTQFNNHPREFNSHSIINFIFMPYFYSKYFCKICFRPSSLLLKVTSSAILFTSSGAFPIATPKPAYFNISISLKLSPMAIIS